MRRFEASMSFARGAAGVLRGMMCIGAILLMAATSIQAQDTANGIQYHGGPVMTSPHPVYIIWYGNWNGNSALSLLPNLVSNLNGTPYFALNTTYEDGSHNNVSAVVTLGPQTFDSYSQGANLSDGSVRSIVFRAILNGAAPMDTNGVYFVLSSSDVDLTDSGLGSFCVDFCGYHSHANLLFRDIKYAFVGNPASKCLSSPNIPKPCAPLNAQVSPNDNVGADLMASTIAHELSETVTDPDLNAWFNPSNPSENADHCNLTFGIPFTTANGAQANIVLGGRNYLIQQNWLNDGGGGCTMASAGNPFLYSTPRDQFLACYGIAGRISSNCRDISDVNDKQTCYAVSDSTQTPCTSMTDRNMQLACYGIAFAPNFPSNCRDITNPQMQAFCYGASSGNTNPSPNCNNVPDADARALCLGMSLHDPMQCSTIAGHNDRQFCLGVSSHDNSNCAGIGSCPDHDAQASCINGGGSWDWSACTCSFAPPPPSCDPNQEQACIGQGGSWDPNTCSCSGGCGTDIICLQASAPNPGQASAPLPPAQLKLRKPIPIARPEPRRAEQK
jgi:Phosphate-induced protein 1 conserved region